MSDVISKAIGLSEQETTNLLQKYYAFIASLNPAQQAVMKRAVPSLEAAAAIIGGGTTVDDLNAYISERLAESPAVALSLPIPSATGLPIPVNTNATTGLPIPSKKNVE